MSTQMPEAPHDKEYMKWKRPVLALADYHAELQHYLNDSEKTSKLVPGSIHKLPSYRPGEKAFLEIQAGADLLIPPASFRKLVREIAADVVHGGENFSWEAVAMEALQTVAESRLILTLSLTNDAAIYARRETIQKKDMEFVAAFERESSTGA